MWMNHLPRALEKPMLIDPFESNASATPRIWAVGALCRMIAQVLNVRLNPVAVRGEISGFSRASSGHCYFTLKDDQGQIRCAMFRRVASQVRLPVKDGDQVELTGQLGVYEARGDLQLVVESLRPVGQGALLEAFLRLKARLEAEGLFDPDRKRALPSLPRGVGIVTSPQAAALHDVLAALRRRAPQVNVIISPALVQGSSAPASLCEALERLYLRDDIDVILLVRGGGSMEDLWAFNDEQLARQVVRSPVPLISGVGHETDFTIADFCADVRAPTPTAAAELCAPQRADLLAWLDSAQWRMQQRLTHWLDAQSQRVDGLQHRLGRPAERLQRESLRLRHLGAQLTQALRQPGPMQRQRLQWLEQTLYKAGRQALQQRTQRLEQLGAHLDLLNPRRVLQRGYALLQDETGHAVTRADAVTAGQRLHATLMDGEVVVTVDERRSAQFPTIAHSHPNS
jgi:exodeoxyribonuclease VII large subunit